LAGRLGDHLISLANNPQYLSEELWPALEAAARESGRDPSTMERVGHFTYVYDPDQVVLPEHLQQDAGTISGGAMAKAFSSKMISIFHSAEDFIKRIEEMKRMGYTHLAVGDQKMAIAKGPRPALDETAGIRIWKDVLPHVR